MRSYDPGQNPFQTSADTRFNSFSGPSAMAFNQQNGQWGVNPDLMTPSYTAAYRPQYNANQGNPFGGPQPTFGQSLNQAINPFARGGSNYGGNTYQQQAPFADALGYNPLDHAASITQKWVVPGFASWLSYRFLAKPLGEMGSRLAAGAATGIAGTAFSAGTAATIGSVAGGLGRFAGSIGGPMIVAQAAISAADKFVFDPFIAQRQTTNDLRRNFAGVTFGGGQGNLLTGKGFSREAAGAQAAQINQIGARDFTFSQSEVSKLTDLSARSGLLDTVQGGQIGDRMRAITKQVKLVMQIGNTSDFKEAIEVLSKLQTSGVGTKDVTSVVSKLGGMASVAGVSLQKMMSTVGAQGEYLFASNGLNPYAGQLTAANAYGAFSMAQRTGLMSPALLARMGGVEGATQSATGALLGMAQTPYAGMTQYNKYLGGGGTGGGVVGNMTRFGGAMARGGLSALGEFQYNRAEMASKDLETGGQAGQMEQLTSIARMIPGAMKNGKVDAYAAYPILMQTMGLSADQARAFIEAQRASQDPATVKQSKAAVTNAWKETRLKMMEQEGYYGIASPVTRPFHLLSQSITAGTSREISHFTQGIDRVVDHLDTFLAGPNAMVANPFGEESQERELNTNFTNEQLLRVTKGDSFGGKEVSTAWNSVGGNLKEAAEILKTDPDLVKAVYDKDLGGIQRAIGTAVANGKINDRYASGKDADALANLLLQSGQKTSGPGSSGQKLISLLRVTGARTKADARAVNELAIKIGKSGGKVTKEDIESYNKLTHSNLKEGQSEQLIANLGRMAKQETLGEGITSHWWGEEKTTSKEALTSIQGLTAMQSYQKQSESLQKGLEGGGAMSFDTMNVAMGLLGKAVDPNTGAMKVINVKEQKVAGMPVLNSPGKVYDEKLNEVPDNTRGMN